MQTHAPLPLNDVCANSKGRCLTPVRRLCYTYVPLRSLVSPRVWKDLNLNSVQTKPELEVCHRTSLDQIVTIDSGTLVYPLNPSRRCEEYDPILDEAAGRRTALSHLSKSPSPGFNSQRSIPSCIFSVFNSTDNVSST